MNKNKLLQEMIRKRGKNILFNDFKIALEAFGFKLDRINGSHHVYVQEQAKQLISVQCDGKEAKAYQVRQFIAMIERHNLKMED